RHAHSSFSAIQLDVVPGRPVYEAISKRQHGDICINGRCVLNLTEVTVVAEPTHVRTHRRIDVAVGCPCYVKCARQDVGKHIAHGRPGIATCRESGDLRIGSEPTASEIKLRQFIHDDALCGIEMWPVSDDYRCGGADGGPLRGGKRHDPLVTACCAVVDVDCWTVACGAVVTVVVVLA